MLVEVVRQPIANAMQAGCPKTEIQTSGIHSDIAKVIRNSSDDIQDYSDSENI